MVYSAERHRLAERDGARIDYITEELDDAQVSAWLIQRRQRRAEEERHDTQVLARLMSRMQQRAEAARQVGLFEIAMRTSESA